MLQRRGRRHTRIFIGDDEPRPHGRYRPQGSQGRFRSSYICGSHSPVAVADSDDVDELLLVRLAVAVRVDDIVAAIDGDELPVWLGHTLVLTDAVPVFVLLVVALAVSELQGKRKQ